MNTGIQDTFNLAWKLALVVKGDAPETLLETFEQERRPVGERAVKTSDRILRSLLLKNPALRATRELLVRTLVPRKGVQKTLSKGLSGIGISYKGAARDRGELRGDLRDVPNPDALRAGDRVPDLELATPDGFKSSSTPNRVRLFELLGLGYTLFVFIGSEHVGDDLERTLAEIGHTVKTDFGKAVTVCGVLGQGTPKSGTGVPILADFKKRFQTKLGAEDGSALLVRPDGYLAFHRKGYTPLLSAAQARWVQRPLPSGKVSSNRVSSSMYENAL